MNEVRAFLAEAGYDPDGVADTGDIVAAFSLDGEQALALMEAFAARFKVDMRGYHWFVLPDAARENAAEYIPTTIRDMATAVEARKWPEAETEETPARSGFTLGPGRIFIVIVLLLLIGIRIFRLFE